MKPKQQVERYISQVMSGELLTGRLCSLAVRRHLADLEHGHKRGLRFREDVAAEWCDFFPAVCRHTTGEYNGQVFELRDFQAFIVWCLFGWMRSDGSRRFRDGLISFARGNGKSPLGAGMGLGLAFMDVPREPRAEVYCAATKREQAKIVWDEARRMVEAGPLKRIVTVMQANMHARDNGSKFEPLGSDSNVTDGLLPHGVIQDELHAWREQHRGLYEKLQTALGKRRQPLKITITTAGDDLAEIWKEQHGYSSRVVEQVLAEPEQWFGDEHFSFVCEVDKEDDIYDERNWVKANPMLAYDDSPVKIDHLRQLALRARQGDVATEFMFRRYHCNQMTASVEKPITPELWSRGNRELPGRVDLIGVPAYGGLDLGRSNDFSAVTLVWSLGSEYAIRTWVWTCSDRSDDLRTNEFQNLLGLDNVIVHSGNQIEFADIRRKIAELHAEYNVRSWGFDDSWARETGQWMAEEQGLPVVGIPQTCKSYNEPIVRFLEALQADKIRHGNCQMFRWQANNLVLRRNAADLRMPDKVNSRYKIDSMVALFMGYSECLFAERNQVWSAEEIGL